MHVGLRLYALTFHCSLLECSCAFSEPREKMLTRENGVSTFEKWHVIFRRMAAHFQKKMAAIA